MATELAPFNITVNTVAPDGSRRTGIRMIPRKIRMLILPLFHLLDGGSRKMLEMRSRYFASDEASFITGQTLCVNGGRTPGSLLKSKSTNYMKHSIQKIACLLGLFTLVFPVVRCNQKWEMRTPPKRSILRLALRM